MCCITLLRTAVAGLLSLSLAAQTFSLSPVADASTDSDQPTVNFGGSPDLVLGKQFTSTPSFRTWFARGHLRFDTSTLPPARVPVRATFHWYERSAQAAGCLDVSLHRITQAWSESTITWANQPNHEVIEISRACIGSRGALGWKSFDITQLVQDWTQGAAPNHGFVIRDPRESSAGAARPGTGPSREHSDPALRPWLEVEYAPLFGTPCSARALFPQIGFGGGRLIPGGTAILRTRTVIGGSRGLLVFGASNRSWAGYGLPLSLTRWVGYPGCELLVSNDIGVEIPGVTTSPLDFVFVLPNDPGIVGRTLYAQTLFLVPWAGFEASAGIALPL